MDVWSASLAGVLCAAIAIGAPSGTDPDSAGTIHVLEEAEGLVLFWEDSEHALSGRMVPSVPRVGEPVRITLRIRGFQGKPFKGPVMLTLRPRDLMGGPTETVEPKEGLWGADFVPRVSGPHALEVSFRTPRPKLLRAHFEVSESVFPRGLAWAVGAVIAIAAAVLGARRIVRSGRFLRHG
ncbi:MAG TPA: hypothetical protein VE549_05315 [Myxococcaceae bacterium]|jgi:hypothetical protein|nr:hypothetical protein [Myxococcaceae bacterium]